MVIGFKVSLIVKLFVCVASDVPNESTEKKLIVWTPYLDSVAVAAAGQADTFVGADASNQ